MSSRTSIQTLLAVVALAASTLFPPAPAAAAGAPTPGVVRVQSGWLRGDVAEDHLRWSAIPYAAPPVGERRWRPPVRAERWSGVRDATAASPKCPQHGLDGIVGREDCLYLDVTVPRNTRPGERLPVLVWLHGGGFISGGASEYDAARLAVEGDVMVVTVNYRLGALGFLSSRALDGDGVRSGNYGLMDQAAAVRWVRHNAVRFGGNPGNVTLAGQSAGAHSVCAQLASPLARGSFQQAAIHSGACDNEAMTLASARRKGSRATEELGCATADDVSACLRNRTPTELVGTLAGVGRAVNGRFRDQAWGPTVGTSVLPRQPGAAIRNGSAAGVPLLLGTTRDEMRSFVSGTGEITQARYRSMLVETFGDRAEAVLEEYPAAEFDSPALALATVLTDWGGKIGACPVLRTAESASAHAPVYAYEFAEDSGQVENGLALGSYHGLDLPYLWDLDVPWNPYPELTPEQHRLSATMIDYWSALAHTGDPNRTGSPEWEQYRTDGAVQGLSTKEIGATPFASEHRCDFWADLGDS